MYGVAKKYTNLVVKRIRLAHRHVPDDPRALAGVLGGLQRGDEEREDAVGVGAAIECTLSERLSSEKHNLHLRIAIVQPEARKTSRQFSEMNRATMWTYFCLYQYCVLIETILRPSLIRPCIASKIPARLHEISVRHTSDVIAGRAIELRRRRRRDPLLQIASHQLR